MIAKAYYAKKKGKALPDNPYNWKDSLIIRKYAGIKEDATAIVNGFIKKIIVHAPEKVGGKRVQKVDIVFNFVEEINFLSATKTDRQGA